MGSMKKVLGAVFATGVLVAGGVAASVALASSHGSGVAWSAGNCSAGAHNTGARASTITVIEQGVDANGAGCSLTIVGKFTTLPAKNKALSGFAHIAADPASGTYTGTIKSPTFHGTLTLAIAATIANTTNVGCGWTYIWQGGHWVALYTTC